MRRNFAKLPRIFQIHFTDKVFRNFTSSPPSDSYILMQMSAASDKPDDQPVDLTSLLNRMHSGDLRAGEEVVSLIYKELHHLAAREMRRERPNHSLQTTALVHEAYLKLAGAQPLQVQSRAHFFAIASQQMRRILVDHARAAGAKRRGAGAIHVDADGLPICDVERGAGLLALDDALKDLEKLDPRAAQVVELRYFGGYTDKEVAESLAVSLGTVRRDWEFARSWLYDRVNR